MEKRDKSIFKTVQELAFDYAGDKDVLAMSVIDYRKLLKESQEIPVTPPMLSNGTLETFMGKIRINYCSWLKEGEFMIIDAEKLQKEMESRVWGYGFIERDRLIKQMKTDLDSKLFLGE